MREEVRELVKEIKNMELTGEDIEDIFGALSVQKSFVGGKVWTSKDVRRIATDCGAAGNNEEAVEMTVEQYEPSFDVIRATSMADAKALKLLCEDVRRTLMEALIDDIDE